ncbi:hypothetical protein PMIN07_005335 [Paraphaeosphaeria minitans]
MEMRGRAAPSLGSGPLVHDSETQCWVSREQTCEQLPTSSCAAASGLAPGTAVNSIAPNLGRDCHGIEVSQRHKGHSFSPSSMASKERTRVLRRWCEHIDGRVISAVHC